ncbi:MAG: peptidylprolyl isomerase, partial [Gemmatimonadota bacterium]
MKRAWMALALGACAVAQATPRAEEPLARVGGVAITAGDVDRLRAASPSQLGDKDDAWLLDILVTRQVLVREAARRGLDTSLAVRQGLERALSRKLRDTLFEEAIAAGPEPGEEELLEAYAQLGLSERLEARVAHIAVATLAEAESLRTRLAAGEGFGDLARRYSLDGRTAARGGALGTWRQGDVAGPLAEQAWVLEPGGVSLPVRESDGRYHLLTVLERRPVGFEAQRALLENRVRSARTLQRRATFVDSLVIAYNARLVPGAVDELLRRGRAALERLPDAGDGDSGAALVTYAGGSVTLEDYRDWLVEAENAGRRPYPVDRAAIEEEALRRTVTERLYPLEARQRGLDRRADMALWAQRKREDLMIEEVRRAAVEAPLLGEAAIARFLAEHTEQFRQPARVFVEAALAMTESDGRYLLQQCEAGGDLAAAAASRPLPAGTRTYRAFCLTRGAEETPGDEPQVLVRAAAGFGEEWTGPSLVRLSTGGAAVQYAVLRLV